MNLNAVRERLVRENNYYRSLSEKHEECERAIRELSSHSYLSDDEERSRNELKKRKLLLKEEMEALVTGTAMTL